MSPSIINRALQGKAIYEPIYSTGALVDQIKKKKKKGKKSVCISILNIQLVLLTNLSSRDPVRLSAC